MKKKSEYIAYFENSNTIRKKNKQIYLAKTMKIIRDGSLQVSSEEVIVGRGEQCHPV